ncbi:MAG TPA: DNA recombination protein RmuC, partial [Planctomycetota bacterium]|nr:DNA recombination protein RmuC [Planctomycetota bacterium]
MNEILLVLLALFNIALIILVVILLTKHSSNASAQERTERVVKEEIAQNREEISNSLKSGLDTFLHQLASLTTATEQKLETIRITVDEKLHSTLEKRLGESFERVSKQLESVHKGLGEMQTLASGVGDLKKVLSNVKTRGTWGEIQLGNLLEQILTIEQYEKNVVTKKGSNERVEFAIKLPGREKQDNVVWLPIDAKFPMEDYQRLIEAQEQANIVLVDELGKSLENRIKLEAKSIRDKYIDPPQTTDFGIMFLPVEGLYAEVLRRPGLCELLQRDYRVTLTGPTTLAALLNSLQMGFRT